MQIFILVCALTMLRVDCQPDTAIDTIQGPKVANELQCGFFGQTTLAATALSPTADEYTKIVCLRDSDTKGE